MLFHTTAAYFQEVTEQDGYLLLDFYAPWCSPCRTLAPVLDTLSDELEDVLHAYSINTDTDAELAAQFSVDVLPTIVLLHDGRIVARWERPEQESLASSIRKFVTS